MKCIQCKKEIKEGFWCSIDCKKQFYMVHFMDSNLVYEIEEKNKNEQRKKRLNIIRDFEIFQEKNPNVDYIDFILCLGEEEVKTNDSKK